MKRIIFSCLPLLLSGCTPTASTTAPNRQITVVGYGRVSAYPDQAEITVQVAFTRPRLKEAAAEVQAVIGQVSGVVRPFIRTAQDLRTSTVSTTVEMELYGKGMGGRSFRLAPELMEYAGAAQTVVALE